MRQRLLWDLHERTFGRFNVPIGSSRIASPAYHDWPTRDKYSHYSWIKLSIQKVSPIQSLRMDEEHCAPHFPNHSLYLMKLRICLCYPEGNFGGNQLLLKGLVFYFLIFLLYISYLDGSISLSPLYPSLTMDLHVTNASSLHLGFPRLHPTQA